MWEKLGDFTEKYISSSLRLLGKEREVIYNNKIRPSKIASVHFYKNSDQGYFRLYVECLNSEVREEFYTAFEKARLLPNENYLNGIWPSFSIVDSDANLKVLKSFIEVIKEIEPSFGDLERDLNRKMAGDFTDYPLYQKCQKPVLFKYTPYLKHQKAHTWQDSKRLYRQKKLNDPKFSNSDHLKPKNRALKNRTKTRRPIL